MAITITPVAASGAGFGAVQNDYALKHDLGRWGAHYDYSENTCRSKVNDRAAVIVFGQPLSPDGEGKVRAYTAANGFAGFAVVSDTFVPATRSITIGGTAAARPGYAEGYVVNVLEEGTIWVYTSTIVTAGSKVALLDAGADTVCASGTASSTDISAYFLRDAAANSLVPIQLNSIV
jgi:hypothetical protein